jgi:hypothetical protein
MKSKSESEPEQEPMSEGTPKKSEQERKEAKRRAKEALERKGRRSSNATYYWGVAIAFAVMCVGCVIYVIREWKESPNLVLAVSEADIAQHNLRKGVPFLRGPNKQFEV